MEARALLNKLSPKTQAATERKLAALLEPHPPEVVAEVAALMVSLAVNARKSTHAPAYAALVIALAGCEAPPTRVRADLYRGEGEARARVGLSLIHI